MQDYFVMRELGAKLFQLRILFVLDCDTLCSPESNTKWSCTEYCPGYVHQLTLVTGSDTTATPHVEVKLYIPLAASTVVFILSVLVGYLLCRRYKKKDHCNLIDCFKSRPLIQAVQETNIAQAYSNALRIVRYENELNDQREQYETLINQNRLGDVGLNGNMNNGVGRDAVNLPYRIRENVPVIEPLGRHNLQESSSIIIDTDKAIDSSGICSFKSETQNEELTENACKRCTVASGSKERLLDTHRQDTTDSEVTFLDNSTDSSECSFAVSEDLRDENETCATSDSTRPKRLYSSVTEI